MRSVRAISVLASATLTAGLLALAAPPAAQAAKCGLNKANGVYNNCRAHKVYIRADYNNVGIGSTHHCVGARKKVDLTSTVYAGNPYHVEVLGKKC